MAATMLVAIRDRLKEVYQRLSSKGSNCKALPLSSSLPVFKFKSKIEAEIVAPGPAQLPKKLIKITDLPNDILLLIFDQLVKESGCKTSAICFGLSNPIFYAILKSYVSIPIRLKDNYEIIRGDNPGVLSLSTAIIDFMGPGYRVGAFSRKFLARSVYGDLADLKETDLDRRYYAYDDTVIILRRQFINRRKHYVLQRHVLPNPHNMGDRWYREAMEIKLWADRRGVQLASFMDHIASNRGATWSFVN